MSYFHKNLPIFYYYGGSPYNTSGREFLMSSYSYNDSSGLTK